MIAGIGFRDEAQLSSIIDALDHAKAGAVRRIALPKRKAGHRLAVELERLGYSLIWIEDAALAATSTPTQSAISCAIYGTGSVAEACALAAAGPQARLAAPRALSTDRCATAALAYSGDTI